MPIKTERTLFKVGEDSYAVTLPKAWVSYNHLKHGDMVEILVNDDVTVRVKTDLKDAVETES